MNRVYSSSVGDPGIASHIHLGEHDIGHFWELYNEDISKWRKTLDVKVKGYSGTIWQRSTDNSPIDLLRTELRF